MVKLSEYDYYGFDLDHTIVQYKLNNLYTLIYDSLVSFLVHDKGYDKTLLDTKLEDNPDFILRGLVLDFDHGNFLKLDKHGCILRASHGTKMMTRKQITDCYGEKGKYELFEKVKASMTKRPRTIGNFRKFETFFDLPGSLVAAHAIDLVKEEDGTLEKYNRIWLDVLAGFILNFSPSSFADKKGTYFPSLIKNPDKYIKKCSQKLIKWMKSLRDEKHKVFLLTNSYIDYATFLMDFAIGKDWKDLFDIVLCRANKPGFFVPFESEKPAPFYEVEGLMEGEETSKLELQKTYSQGYWKVLMTHLRSWSGKDNPKVIFFGDSAKSDIYPSCVVAKWDVVAVLEEMEVEGMVTTFYEQEDDEEDSPPVKKRCRPKLLELTVEDGKDEVLLSEQWGSMFTDSILATNTIKPHDDIIVRKEGHFYHEIETFWGDLIRQCSTIAIPTIDFIADLPLDHDFDTFSDSSFGGFYPGVPKSLVID